MGASSTSHRVLRVNPTLQRVTVDSRDDKQLIRTMADGRWQIQVSWAGREVHPDLLLPVRHLLSCSLHSMQEQVAPMMFDMRVSSRIALVAPPQPHLNRALARPTAPHYSLPHLPSASCLLSANDCHPPVATSVAAGRG